MMKKIRRILKHLEGFFVHWYQCSECRKENLYRPWTFFQDMWEHIKYDFKEEV